MKGRAEHEIKINEKIEHMISEYPEYLEDFNISMEAEGLTHNTRLSYMKSVVLFLKYLKEKGEDISDINIFKDINTMQIKKYFVKIRYMGEGDNRREKSGSYINLQQRALSFFFKFLRENDVIEKNPFRIDGQPIKVGKQRWNPHITIALDKNETDKMYNNINEGVGSSSAKKRQADWKERDLALIDLALNTGLRVSALTEINIEDIDFDNYTIEVIEKGNKDVKVMIDEKSVELLQNWIKRRAEIMGDRTDETDALFISNRMKRISQDAVSRLVTKYSNGIKKHVTPHKLRSTFGTAIMIETGSEHIVQTALNHSGDVTDRYLGNKDDERLMAVNAARQFYEGDER